MRPSTPRAVAAAAWSAFACAGVPGGETADAAARSYLEASARGDAAAVRDAVRAACAEAPAGKRGPLQVLGQPMTLAELAVDPPVVQGDTATVAWRAKGKVEAKDVDVPGTKVEIHLQSVSVENLELSGTLELVREEGLWKVTCAEAQ